MKHTLKKQLFEEEKLDGKLTCLASKQALAKNWLDKKEDKAWEHLEKKM